MFIFNNAEELNELFIRNKDINILLNNEDRYTLNNLIKELSENNCSNLLQIFLKLQVIIFIFKHIFLTFLKTYFILFLQENNYSIEIIWHMHTKQIIDFSEFLMWSV